MKFTLRNDSNSHGKDINLNIIEDHLNASIHIPLKGIVNTRAWLHFIEFKAKIKI